MLRNLFWQNQTIKTKCDNLFFFCSVLSALFNNSWKRSFLTVLTHAHKGRRRERENKQLRHDFGGCVNCKTFRKVLIVERFWDEICQKPFLFNWSNKKKWTFIWAAFPSNWWTSIVSHTTRYLYTVRRTRMISDTCILYTVSMSKAKMEKRLTGCCSNDLPSSKNDTSETATTTTAKRMTTIMNWQIYACSTHSHGHDNHNNNNIKHNFRPHKLRGNIAIEEKRKKQNKKNIHSQTHIYFSPNSSVVRLCDSWDMEYVKWFAIYEKDTNANTQHTYASHDNGMDGILHIYI